MDLISASSLFVNASLIVTILLAIYAIDSWRRSHIGQRKIDLAEETLALFYEAHNAIIHMRSPLSLPAETEGVVREEGESEREWEARRNANVVFHRYKQYSELFSRIHSIRFRFMAQIDKEKAWPFGELQKIVNEIFFAARMLARLWPRHYSSDSKQEERQAEQVQKFELIFWNTDSDDDPINARMDRIIEEIEKTCRGVICGKGTLYSWINRKFLR